MDDKFLRMKNVVQHQLFVELSCRTQTNIFGMLRTAARLTLSIALIEPEGK